MFTVDTAANVVVLKEATATSSGGSDEGAVMLVSLSEVSSVQEMSPAPVGFKPSYPHVDLGQIQGREQRALDAAAREAAKVGKGVSAFAQRVFDLLDKGCGNCAWQGAVIVVMDSIRVTAPYTASDCKAARTKSGGSVNTALERVKMIVDNANRA